MQILECCRRPTNEKLGTGPSKLFNQLQVILMCATLGNHWYREFSIGLQLRKSVESEISGDGALRSVFLLRFPGDSVRYVFEKN